MDCGGDDVAVVEWALRGQFGGDEAGNVGHVGEEVGAGLVGHFSEVGVVEEAGVGAVSGDD